MYIVITVLTSIPLGGNTPDYLLTLDTVGYLGNQSTYHSSIYSINQSITDKYKSDQSKNIINAKLIVNQSISIIDISKTIIARVDFFYFEKNTQHIYIRTSLLCR